MTPTPFVQLPPGIFSPQAVDRIHRQREDYYAGCPEHADGKVTWWKELLVQDSDGQWHLPVTAIYTCGHMISGFRLESDAPYQLQDAPV